MSKWESYPPDHIKDLEHLIESGINKIKEMDRTVFFNPMWKKTVLDGLKLDIQQDYCNITIEHTIVVYTEQQKSRSYTDFDLSYDDFVRGQIRDAWISTTPEQYKSYEEKVVQQYAIEFTFNRKGSLIRFNITSMKGVVFNFFVGDYKICVDYEKWYDLERFEEMAFQTSVTEKRESFDLFFISSMLKDLS